MIKLTKNQVMEMHRVMAEMTGGADKIRDEGLLDSALEAPFQTFGGEELYPSLLLKAARLGHSIVLNHPFIDGNKRTGIHAMLVFLAVNGVKLSYTQAELTKAALDLASGKMSAEELFQWIESHN